MSYFRFVVNYPKCVGFGILLTFFSSYGQTFLISLYVPEFLEAFALDKGRFGALYSGATLLSAASLPFFGRLLDRVPLRRFSLAVAVGLILSSLWLSLASGFWWLLGGIVGLRLTGQGLLGLTAATTMGRTFTSLRGKAVSLAGIGFPLGEALLPLFVAFLLQAFGWRVSWQLLALLAAVVLVPLILRLGAETEDPHRDADGAESGSTEEAADSGWSRAQVLRDIRFYLLLPNACLLPFALTGVFLYQIPLAEAKGWSATWMASGITGFAVARLLFSLMAGPAVDRSGAVRLFPLSLIPLMLGLGALIASDHPWAAWGYFVLAGTSQGWSGSMKTALWAEIYGTSELGAIKSLTSMLMIFATAASPPLIGWLLEAGLPFSEIFIGLVGMMAIASFMSCWVCWVPQSVSAWSVRRAESS